MMGVGLALGLVAGSLDIIVYRTLKRRIDHRLAVRSRVRIADSQ
jgi:hypothetical protein